MNYLANTDQYVVCEKPCGVLSEDNAHAQSTLPALLRADAARCGQAQASFYTVHRLDREVGGVMVCAKTKAAAAKLSTALQAGRFEKEYLAVLDGVPAETSGEFCDLLFRDAARNKTYVVDRMRHGVREAKLAYTLLQTVLWEGRPLSLVQIRLYTGRTHQIRIQFAHRKLPLLGDGRYGSRVRCERLGRTELALFAFRLTFPDPKTDKMQCFTLLPQDRFPFALFPIADLIQPSEPDNLPAKNT